jgi:3-oxoacyl-[acyl-carrier-protein] synthase III
MQPFVVNRHGRLVFPSNFIPGLDFSVIETEEQLAGVIRRDFEAKAPTGTDILQRIEDGSYANRYALMNDMALNLFWVNRFAATMYEKRPTRWRDVPRQRDDVFLPVVTPWEDGERKVASVENAYWSLPAAWDEAVEDRVFDVLFDVFRHRRHHATELPAIRPTVAEALVDPGNLTFHLLEYDPDFPRYSLDDILNCTEDVPELEALHRWAMVLHNQYPWNRAQVQLTQVGRLGDDDYVVLFVPRNPDVLRFIQRVKSGARPTPRTTQTAAEAREPVAPYPAVHVPTAFNVWPRIEALAVVKGEHVVSNDDLIRNTAYNWSPMTAEEISKKTGIDQRVYTERSLDDIALQAAREALQHAGREPEEVGAVVFCSCTSTRMMPSVATWLSGQLGMYQTHASLDMVTACAGWPYGLSEAVRLLQEVHRPVLVVLAEKFSDKIGNVRPPRMIFGDAAAATVVGVAPAGEPSDIEYLQTYASGPVSEVNSIVWPNPAFDNNITVYGPEVRSLAGRYLAQMIKELQGLPDPAGTKSSVWDTIELVIPHQANKTMVIDLASKAGLSADHLYFNIEQVGNTSAASIPAAIADAVRDKVISQPMRIFAPGFGAGAVGGFAVMRIDPRVVATERAEMREGAAATLTTPSATDSASQDVQIAFAG